MANLEGDDLDAVINQNVRRKSMTLVGRQMAETKGLAPRDRRAITNGSRKERQLNLKVTPEFYERVSALARRHGLSMPRLVEHAIEELAKRA